MAGSSSGEGREPPALFSKSLTDLPSEITDKIFNLLPIRDAVPTGVLCSSFRHRWKHIPDLRFPYPFFSTTDDSNGNATLLIAAVNHVLGLHTASPIRSFDLSVLVRHVVMTPAQIDGWLATLANNPDDLRSLTLRFVPSIRRVSSRIHSFPNLTHLSLTGGKFLRKPYHLHLQVFPNLQVLDLERCLLDSGHPSRLIKNCPLLRKLRLFRVSGCTYLNIHAPNLESLVFGGSIEKLVVVDSPLLAAVSIDLPSVKEDAADDDDENDENYCNLVEAFGRARNINTLTLLGYSLTFLGLSEVPKTISLILNHLHVLTMSMDFDIDKEIKMMLCLLIASPNIEQVEIIGASHKQQEVGAEDEFWAEEGDFEIGEFWALQDFLDVSKLQILKLTNVTITRQLVDFMAFYLAKSTTTRDIDVQCC